MKKDTRNILLIGAALIAIYLIMRQRGQQAPTYPTPAPYRSPEWIAWAQAIVTAAGGLANDLFGPGGPFEGRSKAEVREALETA